MDSSSPSFKSKKATETVQHPQKPPSNHKSWFGKREENKVMEISAGSMELMNDMDSSSSSDSDYEPEYMDPCYADEPVWEDYVRNDTEKHPMRVQKLEDRDEYEQCLTDEYESLRAAQKKQLSQQTPGSLLSWLPRGKQKRARLTPPLHSSETTTNDGGEGLYPKATYERRISPLIGPTPIDAINSPRPTATTPLTTTPAIEELEEVKDNRNNGNKNDQYSAGKLTRRSVSGQNEATRDRARVRHFDNNNIHNYAWSGIGKDSQTPPQSRKRSFARLDKYFST
eukprot:TRINITY_DN5167_c0_g1_i1.p1 TRINITY_DN5167_c0_g1~~TRINITY_DN5167_c0_g1_i1.p1  ORF type:complete len:283 (-),score=51.15 TRINITY_DN5167_c0_g1_i1:333-1181(-)